MATAKLGLLVFMPIIKSMRRPASTCVVSMDRTILEAIYSAYDRIPIILCGLPLRNDFEEVTATLQYNLWANVISRLEFRWDHAEHGNAFGYSHGNGEYLGGAPMKNNDFMLAANLIYQF